MFDDESKKFHEEMMKKMPPDFRTSSSKIQLAYDLFGEKNGIRPDIRVLLGCWKNPGTDEAVPDKSIPDLRIILDQRLCLFFIYKNEKWIFDGYECGNYEGYWTEFDAPPMA